jgi:hypothetical protein
MCFMTFQAVAASGTVLRASHAWCRDANRYGMMRICCDCARNSVPVAWHAWEGTVVVDAVIGA